MISIALDIESNKSKEYEKILSRFARKYSPEILEKIYDKVFYEEMLDCVFDEKSTKVPVKNGKIDLSSLLV